MAGLIMGRVSNLRDGWAKLLHGVWGMDVVSVQGTPRSGNGAGSMRGMPG